MAKPKMVDLPEDKALEVLGLGDDNNELQPSQPVQQSVSTPEIVVPEPVQEPVATVQDQKPKLTDAERAKLFQSNLDKTKAELEKERQEREKLAQERDLFKQMAFLNRQANRGGNGGQSQAPIQVQEPQIPEPKMTDFGVEADDYGNVAINSPAYRAYNKAREEYLVNKATLMATQRAKAEIESATREQKVQMKARKLADKYPNKFRDPFTGEVDYVAIKEFLSVDTDDPDEWVKFADYRLGTTKPVVQPIIDPVQLEKTAASPSSVVTTPAADVQTPIQVSKEDQEMANVFGTWRVLT
jgi:hypothetical protein